MPREFKGIFPITLKAKVQFAIVKSLWNYLYPFWAQAGESSRRANILGRANVTEPVADA